ncbi:Ig-like domain-containing protein, partial [Pseudomonas stutzeri]|uniref:Ig-like domain-containing protein n=1 Tax=Stutzerimonas stutzeri TaxID=316 RepID=UPI001E5DA3E8
MWNKVTRFIFIFALIFFSGNVMAACYYNKAGGNFISVTVAQSRDGYLSSNNALWSWKHHSIATHTFWYVSESTVPTTIITGGVTISRGALRSSEPVSDFLGSVGTTKYYEICFNNFNPVDPNSAVTTWDDADNRYDAGSNTAILAGKAIGVMGQSYAYGFGMMANPLLFKDGYFYVRYPYHYYGGPEATGLATDNPRGGVANQAPVARNGSIHITEDNSGSVILNASDADGDSLLFDIVNQPSANHGTVTISGNRATFLPKPNWNGVTSFTYRVSDGKAISNIATVTVTVTQVNDAPSVSNKSLSLDEDTTGSLTLEVADVDLQFEGDSHT